MTRVVSMFVTRVIKIRPVMVGRWWGETQPLVGTAGLRLVARKRAQPRYRIHPRV